MSLTPPHEAGRWRYILNKRHLAFALPLIALLIFGAILGVRLAGNVVGVSANDTVLVPLKGHVPSLVQKSTLVGPASANQSLSLSIGLQLRNADNLKNYVDSSTHANSITKQHLTSAQIAAGYAPLASSQQDVIAYLQSYGFKVTMTLSQHLVIGIQGSVSDAENAFHLQINNYQSSKGQNFYAPASDPAVPSNLAGLIQSVTGLDNVAHFTHTPIKQQPNSTTNSSANGVSCLAAGSGQPLLPSQIATAYNLNGFYSAGFRGEGQTVALVEFDDYNASDISAYTSCYGGASVPINRNLVDNGAGAPGTGAFEDEMDMELILSTAPHLAGLNVYEAPNTSTGNHDMWAQIINNDAVPVISTSWGTCEADLTQADLDGENSLFTIAAAQGQTIFAASGDNGTNDCQTTSLSVDDPASQPDVTGVGGTTLVLNGDNSYSSESVWNNLDTTTHHVSASGGGISSVWAKPTWQQGPGVTAGTPCTISSQCREVPDVALDANDQTGYLVYCTVQASCLNGTWWFGGGTSAAAPMWAAFMTLTNEKTLHDGGFNIGFINPYLYQIDQNASGTSYSNDFHDITTGNNDGNNDGQSIYSATANYDMATGLGSYNAWSLGNDLEKLASTQNGSRGAPANTTWYFAEGSVGGTFQEYITLLNSSATKTANVSIQYLFQDKSEMTLHYTVAPSTRHTVNVNSELNIPVNATQQSISAIVTSDVPIVAERPMYFSWFGINSGTDVLGSTSANTTFYFAQGDQRKTSSVNSSEFLTMLNPSSSQSAVVTAKYFSGGSQVGSDTLTIPPLHRGTISPSYAGQAAIELTSSIGIVAERPTYINENIANAGGEITGAASTVGATNLGSDWLFAEGHVYDNFQEELVLSNFTQTATQATVKLEYTNGSVQTVPVTIGAFSQLYFDVNNAYSHPINGTPTQDVSAEVIAPKASIVAERVLYFKYLGQDQYAGMSDVVGQAGPSSQTVYSFAEGYTGGTFQEWLTLQNPTNTAEVVAVTLFADNTIVEKEVTLPATSRTTIKINDLIVPIANAYPNTNPPSEAYAVSMDVQVLGSGTVVVERPMYFNYFGSHGGTDIIGYTGN